MSHKRLIAAALHNLAYVALHDGDTRGARRMLCECTALHRALDRDLEVALDLAAFGALTLEEGDSSEAARLFGASHALGGGTDVILKRMDRLEFAVGQDERIASLRTALGADAFERVWSDGRSLSGDAALALADRWPPRLASGTCLARTKDGRRRRCPGAHRALPGATSVCAPALRAAAGLGMLARGLSSRLVAHGHCAGGELEAADELQVDGPR